MFDFNDIDIKDTSHESIYMNVVMQDVYENVSEPDVIFDYDNGIVKFYDNSVFNDQMHRWYDQDYEIPQIITLQIRENRVTDYDLLWNFLKDVLRRDSLNGPEFSFVLNTKRFCYYLRYLYQHLKQEDDNIIKVPFNFNYAYSKCYRIEYQDKISNCGIAVRDRSNKDFKFYTMPKEEAIEILDIIEEIYPNYYLEPAFFSMLLGVFLYEKHAFRDYHINLDEEVKHCPSYSRYSVNFKEPIPVKIALELIVHLNLI